MKTSNSLALAAAIAGLLAGTSAHLNAQTVNGGVASATSVSGTAPVLSAGKLSSSNLAQDATAKHSCKGKNDCKGQGGCKSSDNGCKGKNSCKGKGGCATDGSKPPQ
jgi:hypothetical protein